MLRFRKRSHSKAPPLPKPRGLRAYKPPLVSIPEGGYVIVHRCSQCRRDRNVRCDDNGLCDDCFFETTRGERKRLIVRDVHLDPRIYKRARCA